MLNSDVLFNITLFGKTGCYIGGSEGGWFEELVSRMVGDGVPFRVRFSHLFDLADSKSITVRNIF